MQKEKIEINPNVVVAWFDNNRWGDRGDPIVTKIKDIDFGTTPKYPLPREKAKARNWKNIFVTIGKKYSQMVRVTKENKKFYVTLDKEELSDWTYNNLIALLAK